jgi:WD40 repeat protein
MRNRIYSLVKLVFFAISVYIATSCSQVRQDELSTPNTPITDTELPGLPPTVIELFVPTPTAHKMPSAKPTLDFLYPVKVFDFEDIWDVDWSSDGKLLAIAADNGVCFFSTTDLTEFSRIESARTAFNVAFNPRDGSLITKFRFDIQSWDPLSGRLISYYPAGGHGFGTFRLAVSPDGRFLVNSNIVPMGFKAPHSFVELWDHEKGKFLYLVDELYDSITYNALAFSPDSTVFAFASELGPTNLWELSIGRLLYSVEGTWDIAFSPDGGSFANISTQINIWDLDTGELINQFGRGTQWYSLAYFPDGTRLISMSDDRIAIWDVHSGEQIFNLPVDLGYGLIQMSPDGSQFATLSYSHEEVVVWRFHQ